MMVELGRMKRQTIEELCKENNEVLVRGAVDGTIGRVWVPQLGNSSYCLIVVGDFAYLMDFRLKESGRWILRPRFISLRRGRIFTRKTDVGRIGWKKNLWVRPVWSAVMPCAKTSITLIPGY